MENSMEESVCYDTSSSPELKDLIETIVESKEESKESTDEYTREFFEHCIQKSVDGRLSFLLTKPIGSDGAIVLSDVIKENESIHTLRLGWNYIGERGIQSLSRSLLVNSTLHTLELEYNEIGSLGTRSLCHALMMNSTIHTLDLKRNEIGAMGAHDLGEVLKVNITLHTLLLAGNAIGDMGAFALADALKKNTSVRFLDLENNAIGDNGAIALRSVVPSNGTIQTIKLRNNNFNPKIIQPLIQSLRLNTIFNLLHSLEDHMSEYGFESFDEVFHESWKIDALREETTHECEVGNGMPHELYHKRMKASSSQENLDARLRYLEENKCFIQSIMKKSDYFPSLEKSKNPIGYYHSHELPKVVETSNDFVLTNILENNIGTYLQSWGESIDPDFQVDVQFLEPGIGSEMNSLNTLKENLERSTQSLREALNVFKANSEQVSQVPIGKT